MTSQPIAIIPARFASERLKDKPLTDLGGAPLIVRVCENVAATRLFSKVVVAADDERVKIAVEAAGFVCVLTDPLLPSGTDRIAAAAQQLGLSADAQIFNVQGDEPFISRECLADLVAMLSAYPNAIVTPIEKLDKERTLLDRNAVKVAMGENAKALYFSRSPIPHVRDVDAERPMRYHFRHIGVYGYAYATLQRITGYPSHPLEELEKLEQLRWLAHGESIYCPTVQESPRGVDTQSDLDKANELYQQIHG